MLAAGTTLGPSQILAPIRAGGRGEVYRARDTRRGHDLAIQVMPAEPARDPEQLERFAQEARAAGALGHASVCANYDVGTRPALLSSPFMSNSFEEPVQSTARAFRYERRGRNRFSHTRTPEVPLCWSDSSPIPHAPPPRRSS